ncbi:ice-binding family protein [Daejeonella oryzae]|uniref:ice-binding family protein n=1 Tax=Daejeonella oryzae TaxID=1122943 RepID=UPI000427F2E5|nr:ice-binding family protein [Daejeonella oryzae]
MKILSKLTAVALFAGYGILMTGCVKDQAKIPLNSAAIAEQGCTPQNQMSAGGTSNSASSPYNVHISYLKKEGNNYVWIWEVKNTKPGNGENGTVPDLLKWGIDLGDCIGLEDIVQASYSKDNKSWTDFSPSFEADQSANCSTNKYLSFDLGTTGSQTSYYKLVITKNVTHTDTEALYTSAAGCGLFITCGFGCDSSPKSAVKLNTACDFSILAKTGISTTGTTSITGDIGVSPIAATAITGFGLVMDPSNQFSITPIVIGKVYAADYSDPTPAKMTKAISDMETAFTTANGLTSPSPTVGLLVSGKTLQPGIYKYSTDLSISDAGVTLNGGPNDQWIFQIAGDLTVNNNAVINLTGGAQAKNIFWVVSGQAVLGTNVDFKGTILSKTLISLNSGTKVTGKLYAQTAVTLISNTVTPTPCAK